MEFLGSIERFFAELYPHRWPILVLVFLALTGAAGLGYWRGWHQVLWRHRVGLAIVGTPGLAAAVAIGLWLGLPLFTSTTVNEEFPFAETAVVPQNMTMADVEMIMEGMSRMDQPVQEPMPASMADYLSDVMPESMVKSMVAATQVANTTPEANATPAATGGGEVAPTAAAAASVPAGPVALKSGSFRDADSFHRGSGLATIYQTPDGGHLLRLEEFQTTNGPELHVLLSQSPGSAVNGRGQVTGLPGPGQAQGEYWQSELSDPQRDRCGGPNERGDLLQAVQRSVQRSASIWTARIEVAQPGRGGTFSTPRSPRSPRTPRCPGKMDPNKEIPRSPVKRALDSLCGENDG